MPYTGPDDPTLPANVKEEPIEVRRQWIAVFDSVYEKTKDEGQAIRAANGVIKRRTQMAEITIFPIRELDTGKYGKLDFGSDFADKVIANFDAGVLKIEPVVDAEHEGGKAMGWIKRLFKGSFKNHQGAEQAAVMAEVEWTGPGKEAIGGKEFRYFSPAIGEYKDEETGKSYYPVLKGGALTNTPVLKLMPEVALTDGAPPGERTVPLEVPPIEFTDTAPDIGGLFDELLSDIEALLSKGEEAWKGAKGAPAVRTYLREVRAKLGTMRPREVAAADVFKTEGGQQFPAAAYAYVPDPASPSTWKIRLWETPEAKETTRQVGAAIAAFSPGGFRGQKAAIPAADIAAVKAKVRAAWKQVNPDKKPGEMPSYIASERSEDMDEIRKLLELAEDATDEQVSEKLAEISEKAAAADEATAAKEQAEKELAELKKATNDKDKELADLTTWRTEHETKERERDWHDLSEKAKTEGRMVPASEEKLKALFMTDPEAARGIIETLPKAIEFGEKGSGGGTPTGKSPLEAAVDKAMSEDPKLDYIEASERVLKEHPELGRAHIKSEVI